MIDQATAPVAREQRVHYAYRAEQLWAGWWGGWGMDRHIEGRLNSLAVEGWRLVDSRSCLRLWFWIVPRPKLLLFFEKET